MKVMLCSPAQEYPMTALGRRYNRKWPSLEYAYISRMLKRSGITVDIIDANVSYLPMDKLKEISKGYERIFVNTSNIDRWQCPTLDLRNIKEVTSNLDNQEVYLLGVHGTLAPENMLELFKAKAVVMGEPEEAAVDICTNDSLSEINGIAYFDNGKLIKNKSNPIPLEKLPVPDYEAFNLSKYSYELLGGGNFALLEASRGCPYECIFCLKEMYGKGLRKKTLDQLVQEISYLKQHTAIKSIYFIDLEFTLDGNFISGLCRYMIDNKIGWDWCCQTRADTVNKELLVDMRKAGCKLIHFGVESGSERILSSINKKITLEQIKKGIDMTKAAGIDTACFFLMGFPDETLQEMNLTVEFAKRLNPTYASFHIVTPYKRTRLYETCVTDVEGSGYHTDICSDQYTQVELKSAIKAAMKQFYFRPGYFLGNLRSINIKKITAQLKLFRSFMRLHA